MLESVSIVGEGGGSRLGLAEVELLQRVLVVFAETLYVGVELCHQETQMVLMLLGYIDGVLRDTLGIELLLFDS
jgi:hypothetical protein